MASNAVLQEYRRPPPASVSRAQLAIDRARPSRPRVTTESDYLEREVNLGLRAGVRVLYTPDHRDEFPAGVLAVVEAIKAMEGLETNWDSYGGLPLNDAAVLPAMELALEGLHRCHQPALVLRPNGGIGLRWANDHRELEVDIDPDGTCTAFYEDDAAETEINLPADVSEVVPLVYQVCRMA